MRAIFGFVSLLALAFLGAAALAIIVTGDSGRLAGLEARTGKLELDHASVLIGVCLGVLLALIARISWLELPRRAVAWLMDHERMFYRLGWVVLCVAILIFY